MKKPRITRWGSFHLFLFSFPPPSQSPSSAQFNLLVLVSLTGTASALSPQTGTPQKSIPHSSMPTNKHNALVHHSGFPEPPTQSGIVIAFLYNTQHQATAEATPFSFTWGKESLYPLPTGREQPLSRNSRTDAPKCCPSMLTTTNRESGAHRRSYGWNNRDFRGPPSSTIIVIVSSANSGGILPQWEGSIMIKGYDK